LLGANHPWMVLRDNGNRWRHRHHPQGLRRAKERFFGQKRASE
jgi:hypothetical protein